jgi:hypothetical protein
MRKAKVPSVLGAKVGKRNLSGITPMASDWPEIAILQSADGAGSMPDSKVHGGFREFGVAR